MSWSGCKKARPYIWQEIKDHLEDQIAANISDGMDYESAEKAAVKDMGVPVETGISLDRIHKPQIAWKILLLVGVISLVGIVIHWLIHMQVEGVNAYVSGKYAIHRKRLKDEHYFSSREQNDEYYKPKEGMMFLKS